MRKQEEKLRLAMQDLAEDRANGEEAEGVDPDEELLADLYEEEEEMPEDEIAIAQANFGGGDSEWIAFVREHPDVTALPDGVIRRLSAGEPLRYAYAMHENEVLKCRLAILEQNAHTASKSPGSLISEDGDDGIDPFLQGLFGKEE